MAGIREQATGTESCLLMRPKCTETEAEVEILSFHDPRAQLCVLCTFVLWQILEHARALVSAKEGAEQQRQMLSVVPETLMKLILPMELH